MAGQQPRIGCLPLLAALCGWVFVGLWITTGFGPAAFLAVLLFLLLAVPCAGVMAAVDLSRNPARAKATEPAPAKEPTTPDKLAAAKARFDRRMLVLEQSGLAGETLRAAQEKARRMYLRDIDDML